MPWLLNALNACLSHINGPCWSDLPKMQFAWHEKRQTTFSVMIKAVSSAHIVLTRAGVSIQPVITCVSHQLCCIFQIYCPSLCDPRGSRCTVTVTSCLRVWHCVCLIADDSVVMQNPVPNAYTLAIGGRKPFIVVHTALLELLEPLEVQVHHASF